MTTKILLLSSVLLFGFNAAVQAQNNEWEIYNTGNSPLNSNSILSVEALGNTAWIATTEGANYFNGNSWTTLTAANSELPDSYLNDIAKEENGTLWFATNSGIAKLYDHEWTVYNTTNSALPVNIVKSIAIDKSGNKWFGTWGGGLVKFNGNNWTVFNTSNSQIPANGINSVSIDSNDVVWISTFSNGIGVYDNGTWVNYNTANSALTSNEINSVAFDKNDNTWICTASGIVRVNSGNWSVINYSITGFSFQTVYDVASSDHIWFATDNGVIQFDGTHWINHRVDNSSLPVNDVRSIDVDDNMNIWIGTAGGGLAIYNHDGVMLSVENNTAGPGSLNIYPNPATAETTLSFTTTGSGNAEIILFDLQGRKVCTVLNEEVGAGKHIVKFDSNTVPAGVYIWWVRFKDRIDTMRLAVI